MMKLRSILFVLPAALMMATLSNCARVEPIPLKPAKTDRAAWGDPQPAADTNEVLVTKSSCRVVRFFSIL